MENRRPFQAGMEIRHLSFDIPYCAMGSRIFYGALGDRREPVSLICIAGVRVAEWAAGFGKGLSVAGVGDL